MKFNLSQSKIQSSLNFREALQPQSVNKFTLDVCTTSRLLKQSHKFCTQAKALNVLLLATKRGLSLQRSAHLLGATQRKEAYPQPLPKGGVQKILLADMVNAIVSHIKSLLATNRACPVMRGAVRPLEDYLHEGVQTCFATKTAF